MPDLAQIIGSAVLAGMGIAFHFAQEDKPLAILSLSGIRSCIQAINQWIASKLGTTTRRVLQVEFGILFTFGFTMIQIGEYFFALVFWLVLACIWVFKACDWQGVNSYGITVFLKACHVICALLICTVLITITVLKKPDDEPWSSLQKLWVPSPPFSVRITNFAANGALPLWTDINATSNTFCVVPILVEAYLTNNRKHWTMITDLKIEAMDASGEWKKLKIVDTTWSIYAGANLHQAMTIDAKYFDQQIVGKNLAPGETPNGLLLLYSEPGEHIRGPFKFYISDLNGSGSYSIGPISPEDIYLPTVNFKMGHSGFVDLSGFKEGKCSFEW
jgi:hypothetical protein